MYGEAMTKIKQLFILILQLFTVGVLWLVVVMEQWLTNILDRMSVYLLSPQSFRVLKRIVKSRPDTIPSDTGNTIETDTAVKEILFVLNKRNNNLLNIDRETFEDTADGRRAMMEYRQIHNGHLYAVLRPTRAENLQRIENVLRAMTPDALHRVHQHASKSLQFFV